MICHLEGRLMHSETVESYDSRAADTGILSVLWRRRVVVGCATAAVW